MHVRQCHTCFCGTPIRDVSPWRLRPVSTHTNGEDDAVALRAPNPPQPQHPKTAEFRV